jgi:4-amino-4-deoxy-L-arabinose transferase-like glycosyltransferase
MDTRNSDMAVTFLILAGLVLLLAKKLTMKAIVALLVLMAIALMLPQAGVILAVPVLLLVVFINIDSTVQSFTTMGATKK